jgi:hypothetical protein
MSNLANKKLNERLKLVANTLNTIAILGSTGAVVVPALQGNGPVAWGWFPFALFLHILAHGFLDLMRSED